MKNKVKTLPGMLLTLVLLLTSGMQMSGQEKVNISAGIGYLETLNIGIRYQLNQSQIGLSIGTWPSATDSWFDWNSLISISGDFYYHFGGFSEFSDIRPWYGRIGLDFIRIGWDYGIENNLEPHFRIGRDFYFNRDLGFSLDAGVGFFILNETGLAPVLPALGTCFFYRF
jgi:hypothetical protein